MKPIHLILIAGVAYVAYSMVKAKNAFALAPGVPMALPPAGLETLYYSTDEIEPDFSSMTPSEEFTMLAGMN